MMPPTFAVVDLFAGPGGLAEGFANACHEGVRPYSIALSVEKEASAYSTLLLRSFLRQFKDGFPSEYYDFLNGKTPEPAWENLYPSQWKAATNEALHLELGSESTAAQLNARLDRI